MRPVRLVTLLRISAFAAAAAVVASLLWLRYAPEGTTPARAATVTVTVGDNWFCNSSFQNGVCETKINAGDTVTWDFGPANNLHTTTECGASCSNPTAMPLWDSAPPRSSGTFSHTFSAPGTYLYQCSVHTSQMRGRIVVNSPATPTSPSLLTATPTSPAGPTSTPTRTRTPTPTRTRTSTPVGQQGDANKDGTVNAIDAALVLQYSAGLFPSINPNADWNRDGRTNAIDAALILQRVAGLI